MDTFTIENLDLGEMSQIEVSSNALGHSPEWFCDQIVVTDCTTQASFHFLVDRWFDNKHGLMHVIDRLDVSASLTTNYTVRVMVRSCAQCPTFIWQEIHSSMDAFIGE